MKDKSKKSTYSTTFGVDPKKSAAASFLSWTPIEFTKKGLKKLIRKRRRGIACDCKSFFEISGDF